MHCIPPEPCLAVRTLLKRPRLEKSTDGIADYLTGRRVLITGAGGSIGSELCRQVDALAPAELMMLDRDESALHAVQLDLRGQGLLDDPELILADLRDAATIRHILASRRPDVVFHAAALKHLTLLERYPGEAVKTNVWGTLNLLEAATGVEKFINVSSDKAARPISVLGYSKRITERLTSHAATANRGTFLNVRFGNVLGSRGSVVSSLRAQIAAGGPVTVTHPDVTRYFMTVQEAVHLVLHAAAVGRNGEALLLDMGEPVKIADLAAQMISVAATDVEVIYTGLRRGEKLHEDLFGPGESDCRPAHPLVSHVPVPPIDPRAVRKLDGGAGREELVSELEALCLLATPDGHPDLPDVGSGPNGMIATADVRRSVATTIPSATKPVPAEVGLGTFCGKGG